MQTSTIVNGIENHKVVSQKEWLEARLGLLKAEKELTQRSDEVAKLRQELPWVRIDKKYHFDTEEGKASLARSIQRAFPVIDLPLHVWPRLCGRVSKLFGDRGRIQRLRGPPGQPRRHAFGGIAGAACETAGV